MTYLYLKTIITMIMNPNKLFNLYSYLFINIFINITFSLK